MRGTRLSKCIVGARRLHDCIDVVDAQGVRVSGSRARYRDASGRGRLILGVRPVLTTMSFAPMVIKPLRAVAFESPAPPAAHIDAVARLEWGRRRRVRG